MTMTHSPARPGLTGKAVLLSLIGFFAVVFAVNAYFVTVALRSYSGIISHEPYRDGLAYNHRIAAEQQQEALGWTDTLALRPDGAVELTIAGKDGKPVTGLSVKAVLSRPTTDKGERSGTFAEAQPGKYDLAFAGAERGGWILSAEAYEAGATEPVYRLRRRIWLAP